MIDKVLFQSPTPSARVQALSPRAHSTPLEATSGLRDPEVRATGDVNAGNRALLKSLIIVAGHSVYVGRNGSDAENNDNWLLLPYQQVPGQATAFVEHIRLGVEVRGAHACSDLCQCWRIPPAHASVPGNAAMQYCQVLSACTAFIEHTNTTHRLWVIW
jgi:hypothetical protein